MFLGCAAQKYYEPDIELQNTSLSYLEVGKTTKEEVLIKLGIPSAQFEGERILTYRMMSDKEQGVLIVARELDDKDPRLSKWSKAIYSLVLIFDEQGILEKKSLIKVR